MMKISKEQRLPSCSGKCINAKWRSFCERCWYHLKIYISSSTDFILLAFMSVDKRPTCMYLANCWIGMYILYIMSGFIWEGNEEIGMCKVMPKPVNTNRTAQTHRPSDPLLFQSAYTYYGVASLLFLFCFLPPTINVPICKSIQWYNDSFVSDYHYPTKHKPSCIDIM